jgi:predicted transcriptional regulator of viral defense system
MNSNEQKKTLRLLKKEKVMKLSELTKLFGNRMEVSRKAKEGLIQHLGSGFYATVEIDPFLASLAVVAKYYPEAIISNRTALYIYGLSQDYIQGIDIDIERNKSLRNKLLRVHRVPKSKLIGVTKMNYLGVNIQIYELERALAEAYRIDPAGPYFYMALKRYLKMGKVRTDKIIAYDKKFKNKVMLHLQQEMAHD